ncbi:phospholipase D-like domain-containing protein [Ferrovibrio xuzhouensis]|uniref:Phospholipase D n=1 Tax=Ferrovibrio xuzhouensis TaxID=1576914 RepID=A0ABV7VCV7_9PROT
MQKAEFPLLLDLSMKTMHDKILIIDRSAVVTGSYIITKFSVEYNADDGVIMLDHLHVGEH